MSASSIPAAFELVPATQFTIEQLAAIYNQTRADYLVPMPMNAARLQEYVTSYQVDLAQSVVAVDGPHLLGLAMLGVRPGRTWITRLGVLTQQRRGGVGWSIMQTLLANSWALGCGWTILEVIKNNAPAHQLFVRCGFVPQRELLVLRRPPGPLVAAPLGQATWLDAVETLSYLDSRTDRPSWLTDTASYAQMHSLHGLAVMLPDGQSGWLVYQEQRHRFLPSFLNRVLLHTTQGDPHIVGHALLAHLYHRYPDWDTHTENIPAEDPHAQVMAAAGYLETFRRIEMYRYQA